MVVSTVLAFFLSHNGIGSCIFFLSLGEPSCFFPTLNMLLTFYPLWFQCCEITPGVAFMWSVLAALFHWRIFILFVTTTFFIYIKFPFAKSWLSHRLSPSRVMSTCPGQPFLYTSIFVQYFDAFTISTLFIFDVLFKVWFFLWGFVWVLDGLWKLSNLSKSNSIGKVPLKCLMKFPRESVKIKTWLWVGYSGATIWGFWLHWF